MDDLVAGAGKGNAYQEDAYVFDGPLTGIVSTGAADARVTGDGNVGGGLGFVFADLDDDGTEDLAIGAEYAYLGPSQDRGEVYIFTAVPAGLTSLNSADSTLTAFGDNLGCALATGDFDADGRADLLVGAAGAEDGGAAYVLLGPMSGALGSDSAAVTMTGESTSDGAGRGVAAGDVDGDGVDDAIVGAVGSDRAESNAGAVYIVHGSGL